MVTGEPPFPLRVWVLDTDTARRGMVLSWLEDRDLRLQAFPSFSALMEGLVTAAERRYPDLLILDEASTPEGAAAAASLLRDRGGLPRELELLFYSRTGLRPRDLGAALVYSNVHLVRGPLTPGALGSAVEARVRALRRTGELGATARDGLASSAPGRRLRRAGREGSPETEPRRRPEPDVEERSTDPRADTSSDTPRR